MNLPYFTRERSLLFLQEISRVIARRWSFRWRFHRGCKIVLKISLLRMPMVPVQMIMIHEKSKRPILLLVDRGGKLGHPRDMAMQI
jgi:hypothetical protein